MVSNPIVSRFHLFELGVLGMVTIAAFFKVPADTGLPIHWGFDGRPDQIWPRNEALLVAPAVGIGLLALFAAIGWLAPREQVESGRNIAAAALTGLLGLLSAIQFALILIGIGSEIDLLRIVSAAVAIVLVLIGVALPQSRPNAYAGLRLPWTLRDPANWTASHRLTGGLMVLGGVGLAAVAWWRPDPPDLLGAMTLALVIPVVIGAAYSFIRARL